jgi:hypothetical protein
MGLPPQVFRELYKMGHRGWRSVLAQWRDAGDDSPPSHMVPYLSQKGYERYTKTATKHEKEKQFDSCIEDATDLEKQWLINSKYGKEEGNNELTDLLRQGIKHVTYVIMVYGMSPTALPVAVPHTWPGGATSDAPDDVLLLFAPSPPHTGRSSTPASKSAAEQLWGYYPIVVDAPLSPARLYPILAPQDDLGHHRIV